jgi:hypothetical protein
MHNITLEKKCNIYIYDINLLQTSIILILERFLAHTSHTHTSDTHSHDSHINTIQHVVERANYYFKMVGLLKSNSRHE